MSTKLTIAYLYKESLNLYGDTGNVEILRKRALDRDFSVEILNIDTSTRINSTTLKNVNILFMGGGPDSSQKEIYEDLIKNKREHLIEYIEGGNIGLFVCASYQLLGNYYIASDNTTLKGLGIFDLYTKNLGLEKPRCIGNTVARLSSHITNDPYFINNNHLEKNKDVIVGFENHGGRTYLKNKEDCLAQIIKGHGNNSEDTTEGIVYKNAFGTYFHGPLLSKNPHFADFLIAKSLKIEKLKKLNDTLINAAHTSAQKIKP